MTILFYILLAFIVYGILCAAFNYFTEPKLGFRKTSIQTDLVSILIPARNEEKNIENILLSAINQSYKNTEIIVLDDKSTDSTSEKVLGLIKKYPQKNIKVYKGTELPDGWVGKCWACQNLSEKANGEYLLFVDADVILRKNAVESAIAEMQKNNLDAMTVFPTQILKTLPEKIFVGAFLDWLLVSLLPIWLSNKLFVPSLTAANGQFFLFTRKAYDDIGGHERVFSSIGEDGDLARVLKTEEKKIWIYLGNKQVFCRMYTSWNECVKGLSKNYYILSKMANLALFIGLNTIFFSVLILPFILAFFDLRFLILILLILVQRVFQSLTVSKSPFENIFLHIPQLLALVLIAPRSYIVYKTKKIEWKGRTLEHKRIEVETKPIFSFKMEK